MTRILVVDDKADVRLLLVAVLERAGHEVIEASDGTTVQTWVIDASPDVIILDLMMPGMDGWETLARLKSSPESRDVPVIISSVLDEYADLSKARQLGAVDYIPKPWVANDLLQRIRWATTIQSKIA